MPSAFDPSIGLRLLSSPSAEPADGDDHAKLLVKVSEALERAQARVESSERAKEDTELLGDEWLRALGVEDSQRPRVQIGYPLYGRDMPGAFVCSLVDLDYSTAGHVWFDKVSGRTQADSRESICEMGLKRNATHVLMLDTDMVYPVDTLTRLLAANVPVICGFAVARGVPHQPVFGTREKDYFYQTAYPTEPGTMAGKRLGGVQRSYVVGGAALLIRTEVLRKLPRPWFAFQERTEAGIVGEDLWFSEQCHRASIPTYVHTGVCVGHLTEVCMTPRYDADNEAWTVDLGGLFPFIDPHRPVEPTSDAMES